MKKVRGMTLIEMIIAIVLMGIAMVAFTSFLVPQVRDSANPHYQTRASALAQSFMSQIIARGFDDNSNFDGGLVRCGEGENGTKQEKCTALESLGAEESAISSFNDVDDYMGCWYTEGTESGCDSKYFGKHYQLSNVLGDELGSDYKNFRVEVDVTYVTQEGNSVSGGDSDYKRISMTIFAGRSQPLTLSAIRGNY